jgi:hypothetical protein
MGCSESRENITPEELAISKGEAMLGYSNIDVRQIIMVTKRYGNNKRMLSTHFFQYCELLKLPMCRTIDSGSKIGQYYTNYAENDVYN